MRNYLEFENKLKVEGVNFKGFGIIPKFVMLDSDLTLESKAIYAYFCSYAGAGDSSFPSVSKIIKDLHISKNTYYKNFKQLREDGYISVQQLKSFKFLKNIYTINSNPKKIENLNMEKNKVKANQIKVSGLKSFGYGTIPKALMTDERLSLKAKGLYAYFASLTGKGDNCFPAVNDITFYLKISVEVYQRYCRELIKLNYLTIVQRRVRGRLSSNDYFLNDNPSVGCESENQNGNNINEDDSDIDVVIDKTRTSPYMENKDTVLEIRKTSPHMENKDTGIIVSNSLLHMENKDTGKWSTEGGEHIINSFIINSINNKKNKRSSSSNNIYINNKDDEEISFNDSLKIVKNKIEYDKQKKFFGKGYWENRVSILDGIINIMANVINKPNVKYSISKVDVSGSDVKKVFLDKISMKEIMYVIDNIEKYIKDGGVVNNVKSFVIASLYNSAFHMELDYLFGESSFS